MSLNGVDYSRKLAKEREYFQDANRKLKEATDKRVEDTEKRAAHVTEKQRENFIEDKAELETNYQKNLDYLKDKTEKSLASSNDKSAKQLEKEREDFARESVKKSRDFDERLNDIKASYKNAFESEQNRHGQLEKTKKDTYDKNIMNMKYDGEKKLSEYQDRMQTVGADVKDQYNRERQQLVRAQENRLTDAYKDSALKRADLSDRIEKEHNKMMSIHDAERDQQRQYTQDRLTSLQGQFQDRYDTMSRDYSEKNDNLVKTEQLNTIKANREHQDQIAASERNYNDSLRKIELEKRRRDNGSGEFAEIVDRQQGLKDKIVHQNKERRLRDELIDAQSKFENRAIKQHEGYKETLNVEASEATALRERKLNEANADKIVTVSREREKAEAQIQNREHQNRLDKAAYEAQLMNERNNANDRINKLKETFNTAMKELEEKNKANAEDIAASSNKDKSQFMKKVQEARSNEIFEMKRAFGKHMDAMIQDYEQRLATYQRDNEYLKLSMTQKMENMIDQTEKQLESERKLFHDRRNADLRDQQYMRDQREAQLRREVSEMNLSYQKKIDKMMAVNDTKLKLITNDYESKLKELKAKVSTDLVQKDTSHKQQLDRIKRAFEDEKARLVGAYESQIETMKSGHEEALRQMSEYKRLS